MATAKEVFEALNEKAGFKPDNENWRENTFTWKDIVPGKVFLYFQTESEAGANDPNYGFCDEGGLTQHEYKNLKVEWQNIGGRDAETAEGFVFFTDKNLDDKSVNGVIKLMQELERRILFEIS